jgi:hypothetical protein
VARASGGHTYFTLTMGAECSSGMSQYLSASLDGVTTLKTAVPALTRLLEVRHNWELHCRAHSLVAATRGLRRSFGEFHCHSLTQRLTD